jgi:YVTN family beta-propeller protein
MAMTAGPFLYVPNEYDNTVSVIDISTNSIVATIPVAGNFADTAAIRPDGAFVYVASESGVVSVIDTASNTMVGTIAVGSQPYVVAFSPDGTLAYVTNHSSANISVIDTATHSVVATIAVGSGPYGVAFSPDGSRAYVSNQNSGTVSVIDAASNSVTATINVGNWPVMLAVSPDGTHVYVNNWINGTTSVIDPATNSVVTTITVGSGPYGIVFSPDGSHAYVANDGGTVSVIQTATNSVIASIDVGPAVGIVISPDGAHLYVTHYTSSDTVSVIDTATYSIVGTINVGRVPEYPAILANDDAPVITTAPTQSVAENSTFVAALTSTDADIVGVNPAIFTITGGADADLFAIVGGNLVFKTAPDYETDPHSYQLEVTASDGINMTTKTITVGLADGNDNGPVITSADVQTTITLVADLNDLSPGIPSQNAAPLTVGIYTFTSDDGQLRYSPFGAANSMAIGNHTDLGYIDIAIAPGSNVTKLEFLVGLAGEAQHNREIVSFFDTNDVLLGYVGVSRDGGYQFVSFEAASGYIGRVLITDLDQNSSVVSVDNLVAQLAVSVSSVDIAENTTLVAALSSTDADTVGINPATFSITGGANAALFHVVTAVDGSQSLQFVTAPNYETDPHSYQVQISAFDDVNTTAGIVTVNLTDVNEAPTAVGLADAMASLSENTSTASHIKVADITVTDDALGTNALALTGTDATFFEIVGAELFLKAGTVLDFESKASYAVAVTTDDPTEGATPDATSTTYTLAVANISGVTINGTSGNNTINATTTVAGQPLPTNEEDTINGAAGKDTINALGGNDLINGGAGEDRMFGGTGNDTYVVDNSGDVVNETGGNGFDTIQSSISFRLSDALHAIGAIENLTLTGTAAINGTGNALANVITGNSGNNILEGLGGADALDGGAGSSDTATYVASSGGVNVSLMTGIGSGGDAEGDLLLNFENLTGSAQNDTLEGNSGNNVLVGGAGRTRSPTSTRRRE